MQIRARRQDMARQLGGRVAGGGAGFGGLAGGVDLDVDVEGPGGGGESGAAGVELRGFLEGIDGGDAEEVGNRGGEGLAFVCEGCELGFCCECVVQ